MHKIQKIPSKICSSPPFIIPLYRKKHSIKEAINYTLYIINYTLSIIHYQLYIINYTLSIIHYQLYIINYQLYITHYQLYIIHYHYDQHHDH